MLNIAEGSERYSDRDFSRFLNQALTSMLEVIACLDAASDDGYVSKQEHKNLCTEAAKIYRQLRAFCAKVRNTKQSS